MPVTTLRRTLRSLRQLGLFTCDHPEEAARAGKFRRCPDDDITYYDPHLALEEIYGHNDCPCTVGSPVHPYFETVIEAHDHLLYCRVRGLTEEAARWKARLDELLADGLDHAA